MGGVRRRRYVWRHRAGSRRPGREQAPGALAGVRVLDLSRVLAGPYCTMTLGNLGADVVKVERPGSGDDTRQWGPPFVGGEAAYYLSCNSSKRGLTIDLARPRGAGPGAPPGRARRRADRELQGRRDGGVGPGLRAPRRRRIPAWSTAPSWATTATGRYRDRPGYDFIAQAMGGIMSVTGEPEGEPMKVGVAIVDVTAGPLRHDRHPGRAAGARDERARPARRREPARRRGRLAGQRGRQLPGHRTPARPLRERARQHRARTRSSHAADGYVAVGVGNDAQWQRLCAALEPARPGRPTRATPPTPAPGAPRRHWSPRSPRPSPRARSTTWVTRHRAPPASRSARSTRSITSSRRPACSVPACWPRCRIPRRERARGRHADWPLRHARRAALRPRPRSASTATRCCATGWDWTMREIAALRESGVV